MVYFSLITALAWGGSDLFSKMGTNPRDKYSHWRMVIMVGLVMGIHAIIYTIYKTNTEPGFVYEPINMLKYLPVSFMYILSMTIGYAGLRYMELSVSSPICNSSGAVTVLLCFFILGQTISVIQIVAVICILGGILLLSLYERHMDEKERLRRKVVIDKSTKSALSRFYFLFYTVSSTGLVRSGTRLCWTTGCPRTRRIFLTN